MQYHIWVEFSIVVLNFYGNGEVALVLEQLVEVNLFELLLKFKANSSGKQKAETRVKKRKRKTTKRRKLSWSHTTIIPPWRI